MKIAYRTADPKKIIAFGASITKETSPVAHLLVIAADGGSRMIEYSAYSGLVANDVSIANYEGALPSQFKSDNSHTWNGTAPVATAYVFPTPEPPPVPKADLTFGQFQDLCYAALGAVADPEASAEERFVLGGSRYGEIVQAVYADTTAFGKAIQERYDGAKASGFVYDTTVTFLVMIAAHLEEGEFEAIIGSWPAV
jgi:hypothetical protein